MGVQLAVPMALPFSRVQLGPYVGVGTSLWFEEASPIPGLSGGLLGSVGERHRLFALLDVGPVAYSFLKLHDTLVAVKTLYGPSSVAGYEFMASGGLFVRVGVGGGIAWDSGDGVLAATLGLGWKI
jgi:hypothetical protein